MKTHSSIRLLSPEMLLWLAGALIFIALILLPQKAAADNAPLAAHAGKPLSFEPDFLFMQLPGAADGEALWRPNVYHYAPSDSAPHAASKTGFGYSNVFFKGVMELSLRSSYVTSGDTSRSLDAHARFFLDKEWTLTAGEQHTNLGDYLLLRWTLRTY